MNEPRKNVDSNKAAWDLAAQKYQTDIEKDVAFLRTGGVNLLEPERRLLGDLTGVECAIHLMCSHGLDALSLLNLGVQTVVGIDISPVMLSQARKKTEALGASARWIESKALSVPETLNGTADLVYTGRGALPWIHDINAWAGVVARLLKPGGRLFIHEGHPLNQLWADDASTYRLKDDDRGYFDSVARVTEGFPATATARFTPEGEAPPKVWEWQWTLGEVVTAIAKAGLRIEILEEHPQHFWDMFAEIPAEEMGRLPHTYSLVARAE